MAYFGPTKIWVAPDRSAYINYDLATGQTEMYGSQLGQRRYVYNGTGDSAKTLTSAESGGLIVFNRAAGTIVTLPASQAGLWFDFVVMTSVTSNNHKVITAEATAFIKGQLVSVDTDSSNALAYDQVGNGSTHVAITMNGTTTGGLIYTNFRMNCVSSTLWTVSGFNHGSGTVATPFTTS